MREAIMDADTVVNLIGKHYETKHIVFQRQEDGSISRVNCSFKNVSKPGTVSLQHCCTGLSHYLYNYAVASWQMNRPGKFSMWQTCDDWSPILKWWFCIFRYPRNTAPSAEVKK